MSSRKRNGHPYEFKVGTKRQRSPPRSSAYDNTRGPNMVALRRGPDHYRPIRGRQDRRAHHRRRVDRYIPNYSNNSLHTRRKYYKTDQKRPQRPDPILPVELWLSIFKWIHPVAAFPLARVSKSFKYLIYSSHYALQAIEVHGQYGVSKLTEFNTTAWFLHETFICTASTEYQRVYAERVLSQFTDLSWYPPDVTKSYLFDNQPTAFPEALCYHTSIERLYLYGPTFCGSIPDKISRLGTLMHLNLSHSGFSGAIPPELGQLVSLKTLSIDFNNFVGNLPPEFGNLTNLEKLNLEYNKFVTGPIPSEWSQMQSLVELNLCGCENLRCTIPPSFGKLKSLKTMDLHKCNLVGEVPPELGQLKQLTSLVLFDNMLTGSFPREVLYIKSLIVVYYDDELSGCGFPSRVRHKVFKSKIIDGERHAYLDYDSQDYFFKF